MPLYPHAIDSRLHTQGVFTKVLFVLHIFHTPFLKFLELLLGTSSFCDFEDIEPDSLAEGTTFSHSDNIANLDIPAKTLLLFQQFLSFLHLQSVCSVADICLV